MHKIQSFDRNLPAVAIRLAFATLIAVTALFFAAQPAHAQVVPVDDDGAVVTGQANQAVPPTTAAPATSGPSGPTGPTGPTGNAATAGGSASVNLNLNEALNKPSQNILIIIVITVLSVAPALLIMLTSFTRIIIVLSLTRNALGVSSIPPNQVLTGLALFISLFIMTPTFTAMNHDAIQPYLKGEMTQTQAYNAATKPLKEFMLKQTRDDELKLFLQAADKGKPANAEEVGMQVLAPAFILSEVKTAFIIGFVIFIPFLVIDIIVSSSLMSMGMMMLPPQMLSLPFKLLLFVLVDGWGLIIKSLLESFN